MASPRALAHRAQLTSSTTSFTDLPNDVGLSTNIQADNVPIGIVTALEIEFLAVEVALRLPGRGRQVTKFFVPPNARAPLNCFGYTIRFKGKSVNVVVAQTIRMGNNSAAIAASILLNQFPSMKDILMVGIAGGIPSILPDGKGPTDLMEEHIRLGDVIVAQDPILQYDFIKWEIGGKSNRNLANGISSTIDVAVSKFIIRELKNNSKWPVHLKNLVKKLGVDWRRPSVRTDELYEYTLEAGDRVIRKKIPHPKQIRRGRGTTPLVHFGRIGSANVLLKNPFERDRLMREDGIRAVEMEGSGVADASWSFQAGYGVVRGICDYCDMEKMDMWQKYAAASAASVARELIDVLFFEE